MGNKRADYTIEDNRLYKSLSNTNWEWKYIGKFKGFKYSNIPQGVPNAPKRQTKLSSPDFDFNSIFKSSNFKVMMELYDENWNSDYTTVTGIEIEVKGGASEPVPSEKRVTREELDVKIANDEGCSKVDVSRITDMM